MNCSSVPRYKLRTMEKLRRLKSCELSSGLTVRSEGATVHCSQALVL
jgi:hypothetical protein